MLLSGRKENENVVELTSVCICCGDDESSGQKIAGKGASGVRDFSLGLVAQLEQHA